MLSKALATDAAMCLVAVTVSIATFGCGGTIRRDQLPGTYRVDYDYGIDQLTIRGDGTHTQEFAEKGKDLRVINKDFGNCRKAAKLNV
jgi:hypothetical protein